MAALRPINRDEYNRDSKDIEDLKLFVLHTGAYRDISTPAVPYSRLNVLTAGRRVGGMRIRGGVL